MRKKIEFLLVSLMVLLIGGGSVFAIGQREIEGAKGRGSGNYILEIDNEGRVYVQTYRISKILEEEIYIGTNVDGAVATATPNYYTIVTPASTDNDSILEVTITCDDAFKAEVVENPTVSNDGTAITLLNLNGNSSDTAESLFYHTSTWTSGTNIVTEFGNENNNFEFKAYLMKDNEDYGIKVTALDASTQVAVTVIIIEMDGVQRE